MPRSKGEIKEMLRALNEAKSLASTGEMYPSIKTPPWGRSRLNVERKVSEKENSTNPLLAWLGVDSETVKVTAIRGKDIEFVKKVLACSYKLNHVSGQLTTEKGVTEVSWDTATEFEERLEEIMNYALDYFDLVSKQRYPDSGYLTDYDDPDVPF